MITLSLLEQINYYAAKHTLSSLELYTSRSNSSHTNTFRNILNGKIAEFCAYYSILSKGYELDSPDLKIYAPHERSYDSDLYVKCKDQHLHIKSVSIDTYNKYGLSVVFQKNDPLIKYPKRNHWIVIMKQIDFLNYETVKYINSHDANYQPTKLKHSSKLALYL